MNDFPLAIDLAASGYNPKLRSTHAAVALFSKFSAR
jgi:hypothetical protein